MPTSRLANTTRSSVTITTWNLNPCDPPCRHPPPNKRGSSSSTRCRDLTPFTPISAKYSAPSLEESAQRHEDNKRSAMDLPCRQFKWHYKPICFEATGAWGPGGKAFLAQLAKAITSKDGLKPAESFTSIAQHISCTIAKGCAEMLVKGCG